MTAPRHGGVIHTYRGYDPRRFPMPGQAAPDLVSPAFEHLLAYGDLDDLTDEQLAEAVEIDPSQITGLGPSIASLIAALEERKRKILQSYETDVVRREADRQFRQTAHGLKPPKTKQRRFERAVRGEQLAELERLWYGEPEAGEFARGLLQLVQALGDKYEIEKLAAKYVFTGRQAMDVCFALGIKEELETIDRLLDQLREAAKNSKVYLVDLEALARFADEQQMQELETLRRQVDELLRHLAEEQGLRKEGRRYRLTPKAFRLFQGKLLDRIFAELQSAKTGRHHVTISGEGAVELQRTKPYEFGDSLANMDIPGSLINAMIRETAEGASTSPRPRSRVRLLPQDIQIHLTRNSPKCATVVCMDMSGSMRWGGQYVNVKRMALALHGLIRGEYPGDFIDFVEICTLPKRRPIAELPELLPKPVTTHEPWIRLKADMSDPNLSELAIHPHFTNIQHGLALARQMLQVQDTPNRQIILITDGMPTAHFEGHWLYMLYPPDRRTERFTLREGLLCKQAGITINIFLLSNWGQSEEDVQFANRLAERTQGRVFFVGGRELDRFVVWDYLSRRRWILG